MYTHRPAEDEVAEADTPAVTNSSGEQDGAILETTSSTDKIDGENGVTCEGESGEEGEGGGGVTCEGESGEEGEGGGGVTCEGESGEEGESVEDVLSESDDDDMHQLVETLQKFVRYSSKQ